MASTSRQGTRGLLLTVAFLAGIAKADVQPSFVWGFKTFTSTSLPECGRLQLFINTSGLATPAQPPYTFIAYEAAGIPSQQLVGSDPNNLWWTIDHAAQSQLVLSMADSAGNGGGVATQLYNVVPSSAGTTCHAQNPTSSVSITTNTTKAIRTCDVLPLKISGGTRPYTITVTALGSPIVTNFTLGTAFDTYNWVNRASPNTQILASVSDAYGVYAPSSNLLTTSGTEDLTCGNRPSTAIDSTGQTSSVQSNAPSVTPSSGASSGSNNNASRNSPSTTTIVAIVVGGVMLIGALIVGSFCFLRRRKATVHRPGTYVDDDAYNGFGLGKVRRPISDQNTPYSNTSGEITPFVTSGQSVPYTDNPPYQYSTNYFGPTSEASLGPAMQARTSAYSVASNISPARLSYAVQQNQRNVITPPPTSSVASFDPYGGYAAGSIAPSSPLESTSASIANPLAGAIYARVASVVESEAGRGEAGPSSSRLPVAIPSQRGEKQGPVPPQPRRESVYQHEDISDVTELPPAYKERTDH